ncbi:ribose-phosphate diphosphokinase [Maricaulis sp.]|uniref:ribose-phosphate diphosphokinase n=1 Tax=Maricaulis sp. TaxID=1486257 RepID=UPI001B14414D|nr:ribose-phosphate diphosphokinase [Maricaulis sp.]MBO6796958.1 ribose-phosphate pyrophosphokinase [Maricaulis sp.]
MPIEIRHNTAELHAETLGFAGGERHVQLDVEAFKALAPAPQLTVRARLTTSDEILDLMLTLDAITRLVPKARFDLELPYLPYARQDRVCAPGQAFSLELFANLLKALPNLGEIITWDCHSPVGIELTGARNISPEILIRRDDELTTLIQAKTSVLVCPDKGAIERTRKIAEALGETEIAFASKVRNPITGRIERTEIDDTPLAGRTAVIVDDICDGGFTFLELARALREAGADRVVLYVTHGIFSRGLDAFDGLIDKFFTTDSFARTDDARVKTISYRHAF